MKNTLKKLATATAKNPLVIKALHKHLTTAYEKAESTADTDTMNRITAFFDNLADDTQTALFEYDRNTANN